MAVSYKKLWKLLIDKDMKKSDLERQSGITHYALGQLTRGKDVSTDTLGKICATWTAPLMISWSLFRQRRKQNDRPEQS